MAEVRVVLTSPTLKVRTTQGLKGDKGDTGAKIVHAAFDEDNLVFLLDDGTTVTLEGAYTSLKGATGAAITSAEFVGNDIVFTLDDMTTVTLVGAVTMLKGDKGDTGASGVYIGATEPVDPVPNVWIDTTADNVRYDDLFFPLAQARLGVNLKPDFDYTNNGLLFPQNDTSEYVLITCQLPHRWKEGTTVYPHLHYTQSLNLQPTFRCEYRWTNMGDAVSGSWTNYDLTTNAYPYTSGSIHQLLTGASGISGTGKTMSSILEFKIYRTDNVYTGDLLSKQFDVHIQIDSLGSTTQSEK